MKTFQRYLLIQIPGWVLAAIVLYALHRWVGLPTWAALGLYTGYIIKDFVLYSFLRRAYEVGGRAGAEQLVGETGVVEQALDPDGYIQVRGELWHAELSRGSGPVPVGTTVKVNSVSGMTLNVELAEKKHDGSH